jgi:hypothetical protein
MQTPLLTKTCVLHVSPASHESTRASIAEKSATANLLLSLATNAVLISSDNTFGAESYNIERAS